MSSFLVGTTTSGLPKKFWTHVAPIPGNPPPPFYRCHSGLNKHHNALSYHHVHEAMPLRLLVFSTLRERRNLLMSSVSMVAFCRFHLFLNPCCFDMVTQLSSVTLSQPNPQSSNRISIAADCILCMAKGSSTRIIVLQSVDCCWYHDYCVVLIYMFLGEN